MAFDNIREDWLPRRVPQEMSSPAFMGEIRSTPVSESRGLCWFLGQNGWLWKDPSGLLLAVDPYLTDFCASGRGGAVAEKSRRLPCFIEPEDFQADLVLITHSHCDHADPYTWERYPHKHSTLFMAPWNAAKVLETAGIPGSQIVVIHPGQEELFQGIAVRATFAEPTDATDLNHIGFWVTFSSGLTWYNTGDTAWTKLLSQQITEAPDVMTVCINGGYDNLGYHEAAELTAKIAPRAVMPSHFDLMPHNLQMPHLFVYQLSRMAPQVSCLVPGYYKVIKF